MGNLIKKFPMKGNSEKANDDAYAEADKFATAYAIDNGVSVEILETKDGWGVYRVDDPSE